MLDNSHSVVFLFIAVMPVAAVYLAPPGRSPHFWELCSKQQRQRLVLDLVAVVNAQRQHGVRGEQDIWSRTDAWQAWGQRSAVAQFEVTGAAPMQIHTVSEKQGHTMATCHGETAPLSAQALDDEGGEWTLQWGRTRWRASVHAVLPLAQPGQPQAWMVKLDAGSCRVVAQPSWTRPEAAAGAGGGLTSPMPGKVVSFAVKAGDSVKAGQAVAVVEAEYWG
mgnify:CR=1 FL=1